MKDFIPYKEALELKKATPKKIKQEKKVFELLINGKFSQYLKPSEVRLLKWDKELEFTLIPVVISTEKYNIYFGLQTAPVFSVKNFPIYHPSVIIPQ